MRPQRESDQCAAILLENLGERDVLDYGKVKDAEPDGQCLVKQGYKSRLCGKRGLVELDEA